MFNQAATGLIQPVDLTLPQLPPELQGLRIAHLSDLHIARPRPRYRQLAAALSNMRIDLALFTGDYMSKGRHEEPAARVLAEICKPLRPRLGTFGVFGNHDSPEFRRRVEHLPVRWLNNQTYRCADVPLEIVGFEEDTEVEPDSVAALFDVVGASTALPGRCSKSLRLFLSHYPGYMTVAADLGADIVFAGHTHGGQCRLPGGTPIINSCDLPLSLTSGIMRHRDTLAVVTRGLGEVHVPLRLFCPPQLPVYTLHQGPLPGRHSDHIQMIRRW